MRASTRRWQGQTCTLTRKTRLRSRGGSMSKGDSRSTHVSLFYFSSSISYGDLYIMRECFLPINVALGMRKRSPYKQAVNLKLGQLKEGGIVSRRLSALVKLPCCCYCCCCCCFCCCYCCCYLWCCCHHCSCCNCCVLLFVVVVVGNAIIAAGAIIADAGIDVVSVVAAG